VRVFGIWRFQVENEVGFVVGNKNEDVIENVVGLSTLTPNPSPASGRGEHKTVAAGGEIKIHLAS
jgi:hypothetical protein